MPIQQTASDELAKEVEMMAEEFDLDPVAYAKVRGFAPPKMTAERPRRDGFVRRGAGAAAGFTPPAPYVPRLATLSQSVEDLVGSLDAEAINEVFTSSLGYYISKSDALQASTMDVVRHLQDWTVEAAGLEEPPHVSAGFLAKLGVRSDRPQRRGFGGGGGGGGGGFGGRSGGFGQRSGGFGSRDREGGDREPRRSSFGGGGERSAYGGGGRAPYEGGGAGGGAGRPSYGASRSSFGGGGDRSSFGGASRSANGAGGGERPSFGGSSDRPARRTYDRNDKR